MRLTKTVKTLRIKPHENLQQTALGLRGSHLQCVSGNRFVLHGPGGQTKDHEVKVGGASRALSTAKKEEL